MALVATVPAKGQKPTKGVKPRFEGVAGVLLQPSETPDDLIFGHTLRVSPYDAKLRELSGAPSGALLVFDSIRAKASLYGRAKKLNVKVEFAESAGKLYVRMVPMSTASASASDKTVGSLQQEFVNEKRARNHGAILAAMRAGKKTPEAIAAAIRPEIPHADGVTVRSMLQQMAKDRKVTLAKVSPETWEVNSL